jgi:hypothetical protein
MQPISHGKRGILTMTTLAAIVLAAALFLVMRASAATGTGVQLSLPNDVQQTIDITRTQVIGIVAKGPATGFVGEWQIIESGELLSVTVDALTDVRSFFGTAPISNTWVEAKVRTQPDGSLVARKFRPNKIQPGEVVARLSSSAVLTDVLSLYRRFQLLPLESLLSSARIYRFAIGPDQDEVRVANTLMADRANFVWAEVNFVSEIPSGNPYRTWKWGTSDESGYISQNALEQIELPPVQGVYSGTDVIVAVLDTGIDASHPAFAGRVLPGMDLVNDDLVPQDGPEPGAPNGMAEGHGTHISGIITLIAPESKILPIRVLDPDGRGNTFVLAYAVDWAVEHGADIINMSLGSDYDATVLEEAILRATSQGVLVVAAAGNENAEVPQYPAAYYGVLGVTAVDDFGHKADFANYGSGWIDLAAPGVAITSTVPVSGTVLYATWSGTSMAVPFASGAAALVRQNLPNASPAEVTDLLIATGSDLDSTNPGYVGKLGRLINIDAALPDVAPLPTETPTETPTQVPTEIPTIAPTPEQMPTPEPTATFVPTPEPTAAPPVEPTAAPTVVLPAETPMPEPTAAATPEPVTATPAQDNNEAEEPAATPTAVTPVETPVAPVATPVDMPFDTPVDTPVDMPFSTPIDTPAGTPASQELTVLPWVAPHKLFVPVIVK